MTINKEVLKAELNENNLIGRFIQDNDNLIIELAYAIDIHEHEGLIIPYGFINCFDNKIPMGAKIISKSKDLVLDDAHKLANGKNLFVYYDNEEYEGLIKLDKEITTELDLINLIRNSSKPNICIRNKDGVVTYTVGNDFLIQKHRQWRCKFSTENAIQSIVNHYSAAPTDLIKKILDIMYYCLSPKGVGATIILMLNKSVPAHQMLDIRNNIDFLNLNIDNQADIIVLENIATTNDGAIIISFDGKIIGFNAHLHHTENSKDIIPSESGTRHTSARRFSYDNPNCLALVVSSDGPVTIFSDGAIIHKMEEEYLSGIPLLDTYEYIIKNIPEKKDEVSHYRQQTTCLRCKKNYNIESVRLGGWNEHAQAKCYVCNEDLISDMTFDSQYQLIKII